MNPQQTLPTSPPVVSRASAIAGAVDRGRAAAVGLARLTVPERLEHLARLRRVILARRELIVDAVQAQTHKSRGDILVSEVFGALDAISWLEQHTAAALADEKIPTPLTLIGRKSRIQYSPLGVLLIISPWNYPFYQAVVPIAFALAAGNTVVHKPSEWTPLEGLLEDLMEAAAIAPGWVQVIYGDGSVGADLVGQAPDKIMFTGSGRTGRAVLAGAAENLVPVELELGGKDPMIVFDDVTLDRVVAGALWGGLTAGGQSCTSVERIYVQDTIHDAFVAALADGARAIEQRVDAEVGRNDADIGAMTTPVQVGIVAEHVAEARARGAVFHTGGDWDGIDPLVPPLVVTGLPDDARILTEETFGPILPVVPFHSESEVIRLANSTAYGLTASIWSRDLDRADRVARALRCGGVSINTVMGTEATPALPFGGVGASGMGRYKGVAGLRAFSNAKSVLVDKDSAKIEANWFPYTRAKYEHFTELMTALFAGDPLGRVSPTAPARLARFALAGTRLEKVSRLRRETPG